MNIIGFGVSGTESEIDIFDCNFISIYNEKEDEFDYYVERLCGIGIENPGRP